MENILFLLFALGFFILMFAHIYQVNSFFNRLKEAHTEVWENLGQPKWMIHFGDDSFKNAMKYIRKEEFKNLEDETLSTCRKKITRIELSAVAIAVLIIVLTIIDVARS
jgi:predicted PurR-regulated permease PerM